MFGSDIVAVEMSGDTATLSWRNVEPTSQSQQLDPTKTVAANNTPAKIIKVCFTSNGSILGKNFKLVRCEDGWTIRVPHPTPPTPHPTPPTPPSAPPTPSPLHCIDNLSPHLSHMNRSFTLASFISICQCMVLMRFI